MAKAKTWRDGIEITDESKLVEGHSNGAWEKTVVFRVGGKKFKIFIKLESYAFQSVASLCQWTDADGFSHIVGKNPKRDFAIDVSYQRNVPPGAFDPMLTDLVRIAKSFAE